MTETRLSRNFTLRELTKSDTATRLGIPNIPSPEAVENLQALVDSILQPARDHFQISMYVGSGFRSLMLNAKLGSQDYSQHVLGQAADIEIFGVSNYHLACWIRDNLDFDQLILEYYESGDKNSGWVHVSYVGAANRNEVLTISKSGNIKLGLVE